MTEARSVTHKIARSLLAACIGAAVGWFYAQFALPDFLAEQVMYQGWYAVAGAAAAVLMFRLFGILWLVFDSYSHQRRG